VSLRVTIQDTFGTRKQLATYVRLQRLTEPSPPLASFPEVRDAMFENCHVTAFPRAAFFGEGKPIKVGFYGCTVDFEALFNQVLNDGAGRLRIGYTGSRKWGRLLRDVSAMGDDLAPDDRIRRRALTLKQGKAPRSKPTRADLALANWSKKPIRVRALTWLTALAGTLPEAGALYLVGSPQNRTITDLKKAMKESGFTLVRSLAAATHCVVLSRPGERIDEVVASQIPLLFEPQFREAVKAAEEPGLELNEGQHAGLRAMLSNPDHEIVEQGLHLVEQVEYDDDLLPELVVCMLFHTEASVRKRAKAIVLAQAPQHIVDRFQSDRTRYTGLSNARRVKKFVQEMGTLGLDRKRLALGMTVQQAQRGSWNLPSYLEALGPEFGLDLCEAVSHVPMRSMGWSGELAEGMHRLNCQSFHINGPVDLTELAGSGADNLVLMGLGQWDLGPLVSCARLQAVSVGEGTWIGAEPLIERGVVVR
jgi:hypothetical protein